eukprot:TRINITY_DN4382_c0_g1_i2.p1 TRINITY_DN4382_c0_g1~~TRINITY_DN4382_c0_g1_i2.p1  ORF type:complete len:480 (-),score=89.11 TRINITY_DN4382_c0_g1_i2:1109-2548(-)
MGLAYTIVHKLARLMLYLFFSNIVVVGKRNIPLDGPVIFAVNHPNMLMDAFLVAVAGGKEVGFWAKDTLFKNRRVGSVLRSLKVIPVHRAQDHEGAKQDNSGLFQASFDAINSGDSIALFPEGTSETLPHLLELKDGASWLCLEYAKAHPQASVPFIPAGLTYLRKDKWRSEVVVTFGAPIYMESDRLAAFEADKRGTVKALSKELTQNLQDLTVSADSWETLKLVHAARRLFIPSSELPLNEYVELTRRFSAGYNAHKDEPDVKEFLTELQDYEKELDSLHLHDFHVSHPMTPSRIGNLLVSTIVYLLVLLPLAVIGSLPHLPLYLVAKYMGLHSKYTEATAQTKLIVSAVMLLMLYSVYGMLSFWFRGVYGVIGVCVLLPVVTVAHIRVLDVQMSLTNSMFASVRLIRLLLFRRQKLRHLRKHRADLTDKLRAMVAQKEPDMPPLQTEDVESLRLLRNKHKSVRLLTRSSSFQDVFV